MIQRLSGLVAIAILALFVADTPASAADSMGGMHMEQATPAANMMPSAMEAPFVARVSKALLAKYPTVAAAQKAGYVQMTRLGKDGTMIFSDFRYSGMTAAHPNFLWYDKNGKLAGLDYEYPVGGHAQPPTFYPVQKSRWTTIPEHLHVAYKLPDGTIKRRGAEATAALKTEPLTAAALRKAGLLPANATLLWAEYHPTCWDLGFWVVPNPSGAFADLNPLVKP